MENLNGSSNVSVGQATCTGVVSAVRLKKQIQGFKDSNNRPILEVSSNNIKAEPPPGWLGVDNWVYSNLIPTNTTVGGGSSSSEIYFGDWRHAILMERSDLEFMSTQVAGTAFN